MTKITNPHDKFFKELFMDKDNTVDFINGIFPEEIKAHLNLSSLRLENSSYLSDKLKEHFSDIVYSCNYKSTQIKISLLFEHKSYAPAYPRLQLLQYMLNIWEMNRKQKKPLSPVIPIVIYHGKEKWNNACLAEYFSPLDKTLERFMPNFDYLLSDLSTYSDEDIKNNIFKRVSLETAFLLMKHIHDEEHLKKLLEDFLAISKLYFEEKKGMKFLKSVIYYLYSAGDIETDNIINTLKKISIKGGQTAMTTAERLIKQGIEQGVEKGIEQEKIETCKKLLIIGSDVKFIKKITGLSMEKIEHIKQGVEF